MKNFIVTLNCRLDAMTAEEARDKALAELRVRETAPLVLTPITVYEYLREFRDKLKEHFIVLLLNTQNEIISDEVVSIGSLSSSLIHPRECFRKAVIETAASVVFVHNHPSGGLLPSTEDLNVTRRLVDCGRLFGIEVTDHLIITKDGFYSFREHNQL